MFRRTRTPDSPEQGVTRRVLRLRANLAEASNLQPLAAHPMLNVVVLERMRVTLSRCMWWFLALGLGFTTTGVHDFLATGRVVSDPVWWGCWLVEPALAGILITLLRWESEMLARSVPIPAGASTWLKRVLLGSTLVMNVVPTMWHPGTDRRISPGDVFVHIVIPIVVFLVAEVMPVIQTTFADAIHRAGQVAGSTDTHAAPPHPARTDIAAATPRPSSASPAGPSTVALPATMRAKLDAVRAELGRDLTVDDIRNAVPVSATYAAQLAQALTTRPAINGHAIG